MKQFEEAMGSDLMLNGIRYNGYRYVAEKEPYIFGSDKRADEANLMLKGFRAAESIYEERVDDSGSS